MGLDHNPAPVVVRDEEPKKRGGLITTFAFLAIIIWLASLFFNPKNEKTPSPETEKYQKVLSPEEAAREVCEEGKSLTFEHLSAISLSFNPAVKQRLIDFLLARRDSPSPLKFEDLRGVVSFAWGQYHPPCGSSYHVYQNPAGGIFIGNETLFGLLFGSPAPEPNGSIRVVTYTPGEVILTIRDESLVRTMRRWLSDHPRFSSWSITDQLHD